MTELTNTGCSTVAMVSTGRCNACGFAVLCFVAVLQRAVDCNPYRLVSVGGVHVHALLAQRIWPIFSSIVLFQSKDTTLQHCRVSGRFLSGQGRPYFLCALNGPPSFSRRDHEKHRFLFECAIKQTLCCL